MERFEIGAMRWPGLFAIDLVHFHEACHDHGSCLLAAFSQPLLDEQKVKSDFLFGRH